MFGVMLGVHGLAYAVIGGLGAPIGPLIGVAIDIGLLESIPRDLCISDDRIWRAGCLAIDTIGLKVLSAHGSWNACGAGGNCFMLDIAGIFQKFWRQSGAE